MTNTNTKKNSAMKKLLPAFGMLMVSASMLATSTYAWFTMNKEVSVTNMQVKAKAEGGLLINEVASADDTNWDDEATANKLTGTALYPTSTTDGTNWFHANSKKSNDEAGATALNTKSENLSSTGYEQLTLTNASTDATAGSQAQNFIYYKNNDGTDGYDGTGTDAAYYVMYKYYLRVSNDSGLTLARTAGAQNVAIKEVTATINEQNDGSAGTANSADLNKALRVGIKMGGKMYIYAPVYGTGQTSAAYFACTSVTNTAATETTPASQTITNAEVLPFATNAKTYTALTSLPGTTGNGTEVDIYLWYEGEDDNCQSDKITTSLDNIMVDVTFSLETIGEAPSAIAKNEF
jgi:hypothetical protein